MNLKGRTFRIVEREYGYKNQLVESKWFGKMNHQLHVQKLKDTPLQTVWLHFFIVLFLGLFIWLLFFVTKSSFGYLIGFFFLGIVFLVINQLFQKLNTYSRLRQG